MGCLDIIIYLPFHVSPLVFLTCFTGSDCMQTCWSICASKAGQSFIKAIGVNRTLLIKWLYSSSKSWSLWFTSNLLFKDDEDKDDDVKVLYNFRLCKSSWSTTKRKSDFGDKQTFEDNGFPSIVASIIGYNNDEWNN